MARAPGQRSVTMPAELAAGSRNPFLASQQNDAAVFSIAVPAIPSALSRHLLGLGVLRSVPEQVRYFVCFGLVHLFDAFGRVIGIVTRPISTVEVFKISGTSNQGQHTLSTSSIRKAFPGVDLAKALRTALSPPPLLPSIPFLDTLRDYHPGAYIARTRSSIGLITYADAGHASYKVDGSFPWYGSLTPEKEEGRKTGTALDIRPDLIRYNQAQKEVAEGKAKKAVVKLILAASDHDTDSSEDEIWVYEDGYWRKSKRLWKSVQASSWDDVVLNKDHKKRIRDDLEGFFRRKSDYKAFGVPWKRGIIVHDLPGNGKTLSIKASMQSLSTLDPPIPSLYVKSLGKKADSSDIQDIFEKARTSSPCLIIFEDLDSLVGDNVRSFFLNEVDGLEGNDGIMMIGSTNYLDKLDPGISKRPSRFDRKYHFALPKREERKRYCAFWRQKLERGGHAADVLRDLEDRNADLPGGFSFAYLQEMWVSALLELVQERKSRDDSKAAAGLFGTKDELWNTLERQAQTLKKEASDSKKSVEDSERSSATSYAKADEVKNTGFGLGR
ncbi:MAG: hypothetical protein Q9210_005400 [Variospora velana]